MIRYSLALLPALAIVLPAMALDNPPAKPTESSQRRIGLEGRCPVTLVEKWRWRRGKGTHAAVYDGRRYLFANEENREIFLQNPDRYVPVKSGIDAVRLTDEKKVSEGDISHALQYDGRIYLFDSEETLDKFFVNPEKYRKAVMRPAK